MPTKCQRCHTGLAAFVFNVSTTEMYFVDELYLCRSCTILTLTYAGHLDQRFVRQEDNPTGPIITGKGW